MPAGSPSAGHLKFFMGYTPAATSRSASSRRKTDCEVKAMSESIQNRCVKSSDRNLITILLRPRVIRLSLCRCRMQGSPRCALSRVRLKMLAT
jgi:hypothetical protein